jgi:transposase
LISREDGIYAELREGAKLRDQLVKQLMITDGRIQNVIQRYFPEFFDVFKDWEGKAALCTLKSFPFPSQIKEMTPEEVLEKWKTQVENTLRQFVKWVAGDSPQSLQERIIGSPSRCIRWSSGIRGRL